MNKDIVNATVTPPEPQSPYRKMIRGLRANLIDEHECLYLVYTPVGRINVTRWNYQFPGYVAVLGEDDSKKYRFLVFTEQQMASFPIEVTRKGQGSKETLGFKASNKSTDDLVASKK